MRERVVLNVYDLGEEWQNMNGVFCDMLKIGGAFHVGLEVFGVEWSFSHDGVVYSQARQHEVHVYRKSMTMGYTNYDEDEVLEIVESMARTSWPGSSYNLLGRNCCAFCRELCMNLLGRDKMPAWIDRMGNAFAGVLSNFGIASKPSPPRIIEKNLPRVNSFASTVASEAVDDDTDEHVSARPRSHSDETHSYYSSGYVSSGFVTSRGAPSSLSFGTVSTSSLHGYPAVSPLTPRYIPEALPTTLSFHASAPAASNGVRRFVSADSRILDW
jgi:hypothetical protein